MTNVLAINIVQKANISNLPKELQLAQRAIEYPEVQEIIKRLSKYNLGVFMPHKHDDLTGEFAILPIDEVQLESNLEVRFLKETEVESIRAVEIGWRWAENGIQSAAKCVVKCQSTYLQSQGDSHNTYHVEAK